MISSSMRILATISALVFLGGCVSPISPSPLVQPLELETNKLELENHTGPVAVKFLASTGSSCLIHAQAQLKVATPQIIWAFLEVPVQNEDLLRMQGMYQTEEGIFALGESLGPGNSDSSNNILNVSFTFQTQAGGKHFFILGDVWHENPDSPSVKLWWSCGEPYGLRAVGVGSEILAIFPGRMNSTAGISLMSPEVIEASIRGSEIRTYNSPDVQLIVGASGDRAGLLRLTVEGVDELHAMENFQVIERHGRSGIWGISEDGIHSLSLNHYGFILGTHPLEGSTQEAT